jgi:transcriptional regulator with XRE-family HTH domain
MKMTNKEKIELIKNWRKANGYTQERAAEELGYASRVTIGYFEIGQRPIPEYVIKSITQLNKGASNKKLES